MADSEWRPPAPPEEPQQEGGRWRFHRPTSDKVAEWFGTQRIDEGLEHADYVGGVILIPQSEKAKYTRPDGYTVERHEQVYVPYIQIGTRVGYFHRLAEYRELIPVIEPVAVPRASRPESPYFNANMGDGLWWHVVMGEGGRALRYLCSTWRVALYEPASYRAKLSGEQPMPVREGRGTKQVTGGPDPNGIAKAETGAVGRALGVAGILVIGTGIACLPLRAEILTRRGFRSYCDVEIGEDVLGYDAASDVTRWTPLRKVSTYANAPMMSLRSRGRTIFCTPDHKWVVRLRHIPASGPRHELREAQDLARGGPALVLAARAEGGERHLSERDAAVWGWLATDGYVDEQPRAGGPRAVITQSKVEQVADLRNLLGDWAYERTVDAGWQEIKGVQCWVRQRHDFRLSAEAYRGLRERAGIARREELQGLVTQIAPAARRAMLRAMRAADGSNRGADGWVFTKGKRWVLDLFQTLCTLEGVALGRERPLTTTRAVQIHVRSSRFADAAKLRHAPEFPEDVWCPTTDYGTWVTRLDGQVFVTGNTAEDMMELPGYGAQAPSAEEATLPTVPSEIAPGEQPPPVDPTEQLASLRSRALALQTQLQESMPEDWQSFVAWWIERKKEEGWDSLDDAPVEGLKAVVAKMESLRRTEVGAT